MKQHNNFDEMPFFKDTEMFRSDEDVYGTFMIIEDYICKKSVRIRDNFEYDTFLLQDLFLVFEERKEDLMDSSLDVPHLWFKSDLELMNTLEALVNLRLTNYSLSFQACSYSAPLEDCFKDQFKEFLELLEDVDYRECSTSPAKLLDPFGIRSIPVQVHVYVKVKSYRRS